MTDRRGMALLAALWFVVAIAIVGLALGLEAREHRLIGQAAADRRAAEAAAVGGLAIAEARLERIIIAKARLEEVIWQQLRSRARSMAELKLLAMQNQLLPSDPWLDVDSLFRDTLSLGNFAVRLHVEDLQAKLNINAVPVDELRSFLGFVLRDYETADALAQAIVDWRDRDDLPQPRGAERDDYIAHRRLDLPTNGGGFRDVEELRVVRGMTPKIFDRIRPYLRVHGDPAINVYSAPAPVLRAIPGMTDAVVTRVLAARSQHQHVGSLIRQSVPTLEDHQPPVLAFETTQLELTVTVVPPLPAPVVKKVWTIVRGGGIPTEVEGPARVEWTDLGGRYQY